MNTRSASVPPAFTSRARWLLRIPSGALWVIEGGLIAVLVVSIFFARREDVTVDAILSLCPEASSRSDPVALEERAVEVMHAVYGVLMPRLKSLEGTGLGSDFWFRSTYTQMMAPSGRCGSFSHVLARALQRDGYEVKVAQMLVNGTWGAHIFVVADIDGRLVALDPFFDVAFRGPNGRLATIDEIGADWERFRTQCPPDYDPSYRYEGVRFTNWRGIPMDLLGPFFGRVSLRAHVLNVYWVTASFAAAGLVLCVPLHVLRQRLSRRLASSSTSVSALLSEISSELRLLCALYMKTGPSDATVQPTVVVGEAFVRLARYSPAQFKDENEFRAVASSVLREVLADRARKRLERKRRSFSDTVVGGTGVEEDAAEFRSASPELFLSLEAAFKALAEQDRRAARVAELLIFGSLPTSAAASAVGCTEEAASKDWIYAKSFIQRYLREHGVTP